MMLLGWFLLTLINCTVLQAHTYFNGYDMPSKLDN